MCLVERQEAGGRAGVEKAAAPAPFVSIFTASDVRREHMLQKDVMANAAHVAGVTCELCGHPAVTNTPRKRCAEHRA